MENVYLSLGANLNDPFKTLKTAFNFIKKIEGVVIKNRSSIYLTSPLSPIPQKDYLNFCLHLQTNLSPVELFLKLKTVEDTLGVKPNNSLGPRILGIDILFYGNVNMQKVNLIIPHPRWKKCLYMLIPLYEITTRIEVPGRGIVELSPIIENCSLLDTQRITVYHHTKEVHEPDQIT